MYVREVFIWEINTKIMMLNLHSAFECPLGPGIQMGLLLLRIAPADVMQWVKTSPGLLLGKRLFLWILVFAKGGGRLERNFSRRYYMFLEEYHVKGLEIQRIISFCWSVSRINRPVALMAFHSANSWILLCILLGVGWVAKGERGDCLVLPLPEMLLELWACERFCLYWWPGPLGGRENVRNFHWKKSHPQCYFHMCK